MHMPFINWRIPVAQMVLVCHACMHDACTCTHTHTCTQEGESASAFTVSIRPPTDMVLADIIVHKHWEHITYLHDGADCI